MMTGLDEPCHPPPKIMLHSVSSGFGLGVNESEDSGEKGSGSDNKSQQVIAAQACFDLTPLSSQIVFFSGLIRSWTLFRV
jgi:hypothetical protein